MRRCVDGDVDEAVLDVDDAVLWPMQWWMGMWPMQWCGWLPRETAACTVVNEAVVSHLPAPTVVSSTVRKVELFTNGEHWVLVGVAILVWGSFTVPIKCKAVQDAQLHPLVFQALYCTPYPAHSPVHLADIHVCSRRCQLAAGAGD